MTRDVEQTMATLGAGVALFEFSAVRRADAGRRNAPATVANSAASTLPDTSTSAIATRYQGLWC